jgi:hypothetical protein
LSNAATGAGFGQYQTQTQSLQMLAKFFSQDQTIMHHDDSV